MSEVNIVAITQPRIEGVNTAEEFIAYAARVSNPSNQMNMLTSEKLLHYCIRKQHWSIFETVNIVVEIKTTRDIGRQILRHRSFTFQEFSQRYANPTKMPFEIRECRLQDNKNRQNSIETDNEDLKMEWVYRQELVIDLAKQQYQWAIDNNIAKEQARVVLPEGNTMSVMYMAGTLRSWIHYCALRSAPGTQKEHMKIAKDIFQLLMNEFKFLKTLTMNEATINGTSNNQRKET